MIVTWISKRSWDLAHAITLDSTHEFRGVEYARTLCGRTVRAELLVGERLFADRCKRCIGKEATP